MQRRQLLQSAAVLVAPALGTLGAAFAQAPAFPVRPIKLVIAFPAGGPTDITMRSLAEDFRQQARRGRHAAGAAAADLAA